MREGWNWKASDEWRTGRGSQPAPSGPPPAASGPRGREELDERKGRADDEDRGSRRRGRRSR